MADNRDPPPLFDTVDITSKLDDDEDDVEDLFASTVSVSVYKSKHKRILILSNPHEELLFREWY